MRPIILGYFFPTITMEICTFHFRTSISKVGNFFSNFSFNFYRTYERGVVDIDITIIPYNTDITSTELPRVFCARIGPLQLGIVLVFLSLTYSYPPNSISMASQHKHRPQWLPHIPTIYKAIHTTRKQNVLEKIDNII